MLNLSIWDKVGIIVELNFGWKFELEIVPFHFIPLVSPPTFAMKQLWSKN